MPARPQTTVYLDGPQKVWLSTYAKALHLKESEVIRLLVAHEEATKWLRRAVKEHGPVDPNNELVLVSQPRRKQRRRK